MFELQPPGASFAVDVVVIVVVDGESQLLAMALSSLSPLQCPFLAASTQAWGRGKLKEMRKETAKEG